MLMQNPEFLLSSSLSQTVMAARVSSYISSKFFKIFLKNFALVCYWIWPCDTSWSLLYFSNSRAGFRFLGRCINHLPQEQSWFNFSVYGPTLGFQVGFQPSGPWAEIFDHRIAQDFSMSDSPQNGSYIVQNRPLERVNRAILAWEEKKSCWDSKRASCASITRGTWWGRASPVI